MELKIKEYSKLLHDIVENISTVIIGKEKTIELVVLSLISGGHVLLEDIPGVGKTSLVSALAKSVVCDFKRIQFTPDILPSDITGFSVYNQKKGDFEFRAGAAMSNFVLADEINRASAKSQASLLEIMEEKQVTVDSKTYKLEEPFMVLATQNPVESLGTYPLPEAQLDRFQIKTSLGYPSPEEEVKIITMDKSNKKELKSVATGKDIIEIKDFLKNIKVDKSVAKYIVDIVTASRNHEDIKLGASPRGSIALYEMGQAYALYNGREYVIPDDIKYLAPHVLPHRFILTHKAKVSKRTEEDVMKDILDNTEVLKNI
ncbi:MoxR family ATPase [Clostridium sporogenes]|uniref:AAA family ATPase n=1 Tax=Clostridium TaxID=1485 RepID=UPI001EE14B51|nr:MoxR family ATPase [Clostridium cochlearium]MBV1818516.1 MoxR family ATPase [Bacteroidales bacterium MSK.15.36]MCG4580302.1 MoxR family ATPase [Clostridium cochlearium]